jgi:hypothetical protein
MKNTDKSLQKFTDFESKKNHLLSLSIITPADIQILTKSEESDFFTITLEMLNTLKGNKKDEFIDKIEPITPSHVKNQLWEINHHTITYAVTKLIKEYGCMPSKNLISEETKLSRQTVHKHFKNFSSNPSFKFEIEQFKYMSSKVLASLFKYAVNGDVRACKVYLDMVGFKNEPIELSTTNTQNNFIQINNTILNQENLAKLNQNQIIEIENILKLALPEGK